MPNATFRRAVSLRGIRYGLGAAIDSAIAAYVAKYWDDPAVHAEMTAFVRSQVIVEFVPERAFGIIEREEECARRATRWSWPQPA